MKKYKEKVETHILTVPHRSPMTMTVVEFQDHILFQISNEHGIVNDHPALLPWVGEIVRKHWSPKPIVIIGSDDSISIRNVPSASKAKKLGQRYVKGEFNLMRDEG